MSIESGFPAAVTGFGTDVLFTETSPHQFPRAGLRLETVKILLTHRRSLVNLFSLCCAGSTLTP